MPPTVIFLHVPKAAGSTLHKILDRQYPRGAVHRFDLQLPGAWERLQARCAGDKPPQCVKGHLPYGVHRLLATPCVYFTLLRDPVRRVLSKFYYLRQHPPLQARLGLLPGDLESLDAFMAAQEARGAMNFQTRLLGGFLDPAQPATAPYAPLPADAVRQAQQNVDVHFPVVGLVERFNESVLLLRRAFGWRRVWIVNRNVAPREAPPPPPAPETVHRLSEANAADVALYTAAKVRFEAQVRDYGQTWSADLRRLEQVNRRHAVLDGLVSHARAGIRRARENQM